MEGADHEDWDGRRPSEEMKSREEENGSSTSDSSSSFPDEVLEHVLAFVSSHRDRNAVSLVCKAWFRAEAWSRRSVFVGNCYSCSPQILVSRFPRLRSLTLKGKPHFADFDLVPPGWGANVFPWILELARSCPFLEELRLKRMTVTDDSLHLIAHCFFNFRVLVLTICDGFSTAGLAEIAGNCRHLTELDLEESFVDPRGGEWLSSFPETFTSLTSLNFTSLSSKVNFEDLERLVARCTNLKRLKLNRHVTLDQLQRLLAFRASNLIELGTGSFIPDLSGCRVDQFRNVLSSCKNLKSLSGFWEVAPLYLSLIYPVCCNLTFLNLIDAPIGSSEFAKLINRCQMLQRLWVQDIVEDKGLEAAAVACKDLRELRVFPADPSRDQHSPVTEKGLAAISRGCGELRYVLYFCNQMTNAVLHVVAKNCPKLTHFRLAIMTLREPDYMTREPMDEGFGAVVSSCKKLRRLSVSGLLTDRAFELIGKHAKELRSLSVAFAGESWRAMADVLQGCEKLKKLEIRDSPFGDAGLWSGLASYYSMRSLWMSTCNVSVGACERLAKLLPGLNVEIIRDDEEEDDSRFEPLRAEKLYLYRSLAGPRTDLPSSVYTL